MASSFVRLRTAVCLLLLAGGLVSLSSAADPFPDDPNHVRVRLSNQSTVESVELTVKEGQMVVHLPDDGGTVMRLQSGETTTLGIRREDVYVRRGRKGLYATSLALRPVESDATWRLSFENATKTYTGSLSLKPDPDANASLLAVNEVPIEDYVASVVASEYGLDDREGTKAMAVVARTYGLFTSEKFGGTYDQADGTVSQVYNGVGAVTERSRSATRATRGKVLVHNGNLIQSVYFSSSGGHTADNEDVWNANQALPYLRGKDDPYDSASPHHTWSASVNRSMLLEAVTRAHGSLVKGFLIEERSPHGRIQTIDLLLSDGSRHAINANAFRLIVNRGVEGTPLKSTWFDARKQGSNYVFDGRGFGHGVGLNQWGAHNMAQKGKSYRDILSFYYTDVQIQTLEGIEKDNTEEAPIAREPREPKEPEEPEEPKEPEESRDPSPDTDDQPRIGW